MIPIFKDKKIFVLGMGRSGVAVSKILYKNNHILLTDTKGYDIKLIRELEDLGINVVITNEQEELLNKNYDYVIKNPGVRPDNKTVEKAKKLGIPVINEMEVSYNLIPKNVKIIGITGSNGKTTTTFLLNEMLKVAELPVKACGNFGIPVAEMLPNIKENDILLLEISSHQLLDLDKFKTNISVLTNLSEVHLDHFGTYENYKKNKQKIFNHHTNNDIAVLNYNDEELIKLTKNINSKKIYFSRDKETDCYIKNNKILYKDEEICEINDIRIKGIHNYENVMCAIMVAKEFNVSNEKIKEALNNFGGVEHRMEFVRRINEREFYNDSKATNVTSTVVALSSFDKSVILLLGGYDRGHSFDELNGHMNNVKYVICYGETKEKIKTYCEKHNIDVNVVDNLEEAVKLAHNISTSNDTILLSPGCASLDQYKSFEQRGNEFKKIVDSLQEGKEC